MNTKKIFVIALAVITVTITACEKLPLQKSREYKTSFFQNDLNKSVIEFMDSRQDLFAGTLDALAYVNEDPAYADVKQAYESQGNTFLLMADTDFGPANYFSLNLVDDDDNPSTPRVIASTMRQYPREQIANLLRYHVVKGRRDFANLSSTARWYDTFAMSSTNDSAKVRMFMTNDRDGLLRLNVYTGSTVNAAPRTPNLFATNGVVHVLNFYLIQPTRQAIINNP
jgi:uncharacterized surface protein with fasciclin (FAS1) repeats